ncbi:MAG TPA: ERF family protein [Pseudomonadales bacterium]|nr:ERF family protein [Pseudomonadales bacterium]
MKNLATALVKAQKAFSPALKNSTNPHFKSRYADLATCVEAVMDALNENGIALIQKCYECPSGIMVETVFMHESGEIYEAGILQFPASKQDPQGYMSALTYARRGSLMAACGIAPEDDDGNAASRKPTMDVSWYVSRIGDAENLQQLKEEFSLAIAACGSDSQAKAKVIAAKDARKAAL